MSQISKLLEKYELSDIKASDSEGNTIFHITVKNEELTSQEKIQVFKTLFEQAIDPNVENGKKETVLKLAIAYRKKDIIDFLLTRKIDIDDSISEFVVRSEYNKFQELLGTTLEISDAQMQKIESESTSFVKWLITKGLLNVNQITIYGHKVVIMAINYNLHHLLPAMLTYANDVNYVIPKSKETLLHEFLKSNASLKDCRWSSYDISSYIHRYAVTIVKIMLEKGVSPDSVDANGNTALHVAIVKKENFNVVDILIDHTTNINHQNSEGKTAFNIAISNWVSLEVSENTQVDNYMKIAQALISKGADIDKGDNNEMSPICIAIEKRHLNAVEFLRENRADFNVTTPNGETLLHLFVKNSNPVITGDVKKLKIIDILISSGCNVNAKDKTGETALHIAVKKGNVAIIQSLIGNGVEINCKNNRGETPLCCLVYVHDYNINNNNNNMHHDRARIAAIFSMFLSAFKQDDTIKIYNEVLELLLKYGADFNEKVSDGHSILQVALWQKYSRRRNQENIAIDDLPSFIECLRDSNSIRIRDLLIHWIKLHVANLKCNTGFEYADLMTEEQYRKIDYDCRKEIEKLKNTSIDSRTTLYNVLHMNLNSRRAYINNEKLKKFIQSRKLNKQFPRYAVLIFASHREAMKRKSLMDPAKKAWIVLTKIELPEVCIELIFSFLSNTEMFNFIEKSGSTN